MLDCLCNGIEGFIYPQSISLAQRLFESLGNLTVQDRAALVL